MSGLEQWLSFIEQLEKEWPKAEIGKSWIKTCPVDITHAAIIENPFEVCKYENPTLKIAQLEKQYLNVESKNEALRKWKNGAQLVKISLIGGEKWGTTKNNKHCLRELIISRENKEVQISVRCSDFIKKFPIDVYFLHNVVLKEFDVEDYNWVFMFDSIMLRSPFYYIYLEQVYHLWGEEALIQRLLQPSNMMQSFLNYYHKNMDNDITYKSLNRARERFMECDCYPMIFPFIEDYARK